MKCIFIVLDLGSAIRNILRTEVFSTLKSAKDVKIVLFSPGVDEDFRKEFEDEHVRVEKVPKWRANWLVKLIRSWKQDLWARHAGVFSFRQRRKKRTVRKFVIEGLAKGLSRKRFASFLCFLQRVETFFTPRLARNFFDTYSPDLVFYTSLYPKDPCIEIGASKRGIKTVCFVHSWDNPTTKGPFHVIPDRMIVWNEILKDEITRFHGYPPERVSVAGVPQFDIYSQRHNFLRRDDFFMKWNLDPRKKLLTYTTGSPGMIPYEPEVVEALYDAVRQERFDFPCQILVRLHPKDRRKRYAAFEGMPLLTLQRPGRAAATADGWNPTLEDMYGLAELMCYSDVVINVASTITIDAAAFDTPVVNVAFDGDRTVPYRKSCKRYYDYEHYRNIVKTKGIRIADSRQEMISHINAYLNDPSLDTDGRKRIIWEQCWKLDGNSGKRIAESVLSYLYGVEAAGRPAKEGLPAESGHRC
jgi:hypothetical protein